MHWVDSQFSDLVMKTLGLTTALSSTRGTVSCSIQKGQRRVGVGSA